MKLKTLKMIIICALIALTLFAVSCGKNVERSPETTRVGDVTKKPEPSGSTQNSEKIMREYADRYGATKIFQDACVPQKYLLCNEESVVYLFAIEGATECTVISLEAIEKYKRFDIGNLTQFTIYNRTASEISFFVHGQDAEALEEIFH